MDDLKALHGRLVQRHRPLLARAAGSLLAEPAWSLATVAALVKGEGTDGGRLVAVGELGRCLDHLGPELDAFVRLRREGVTHDEAHARCLREQGPAFAEALERARRGHPLVSHDDLAFFASLSQRGFARDPRELLVVVRWPEQVSVFLLACERQDP